MIRMMAVLGWGLTHSYLVTLTVTIRRRLRCNVESNV